MTDTTQPPAETLVRISREQFPEIIQAARWMDEDNGTLHFEPGVGFIIDDPDGLSVPVRWIEHLPTIEAALTGLDHVRPHPDDVDTLEWLAREGKEPTVYESAVHCFVSGEHTPVTIMARSSRDLYLANRFLNERFEGWSFDPAADFEDLTSRAGGDAIGQSDGDPDGWLAVKVNEEGGIVMPYGPLHAGPDRPNDSRYRWAPFYIGDTK